MHDGVCEEEMFCETIAVMRYIAVQRLSIEVSLCEALYPLKDEVWHCRDGDFPIAPQRSVPQRDTFLL